MVAMHRWSLMQIDENIWNWFDLIVSLLPRALKALFVEDSDLPIDQFISRTLCFFVLCVFFVWFRTIPPIFQKRLNCYKDKMKITTVWRNQIFTDTETEIFFRFPDTNTNFGEVLLSKGWSDNYEVHTMYVSCHVWKEKLKNTQIIRSVFHCEFYIGFIKYLSPVELSKIFLWPFNSSPTVFRFIVLKM